MNITYQLLLLNQPIILSNQDINNDLTPFYDFRTNTITKLHSRLYGSTNLYSGMNGGICHGIEDSKKIIAGIDNLPKIDFNSLSLDDSKKINVFNIDKLAKINCNIQLDLILDEKERHYKNYQKYDGFIEGFKNALDITERSFTKKDMINFATLLSNYRLFNRKPSKEIEYFSTRPDFKKTNYSVEEYLDIFINKNNHLLFNIDIDTVSNTFYNEETTEETTLDIPNIVNNTIKITKIY